MRNIAQLLFMLLFIQPVLGQDSTSVTYSEVSDTLVKQRFIDRYETVFMTKVPTRHMFKVGLSQYLHAMPAPLLDDKLANNASLHLGYEFKFLPSFSVALSGHLPYIEGGQPIRKSLMFTVLDAQLRWFFDMRKRVRAGKAASNFSGNYVSLFYNMPGTLDNAPNVGIKLGFQRRFLNAGFMDFAVALQQDPKERFGMFGLSISTQATFGLAFGDWKKSKIGPLCDVLRCDEHVTSQWKVRLPELSLGYYFNRIRLGIAFEQKVSSLPLSLNFELNVGMTKGWDHLNKRNYIMGYGYVDYVMLRSRELLSTLSLQPRYYLLHKKQRLNGKGGNGFSGIYTGLNSDYSYYFGHHSNTDFQTPDIDLKKHIVKAGPLFGFQQRLFRHGYLDVNASMNYQNQALIDSKHFYLKTSIALGLAW